MVIFLYHATIKSTAVIKINGDFIFVSNQIDFKSCLTEQSKSEKRRKIVILQHVKTVKPNNQSKKRRGGKTHMRTLTYNFLHAIKFVHYRKRWFKNW